MPLEDYKKKRDFSQTSEPVSSLKPTGKIKESEEEKLIFVVQRHEARRLHYDFRLEMEGVLKSWAVPKGPSLNPSDKRLAIMVEDHPYDYRTFEGAIPKGNYGAGEVIIWDEGFYEPLEREKGKSDQKLLIDNLNKGSLKIVMYGKKLKGEFALIKMQNAKEQNAWLLIKHNDKYAISDSYDAEDFQVKPERQNTNSNNQNKEYIRNKSKNRQKLISQEKLQNYIKPMLATQGTEPFDDDKWLFEIKWDGYRAIADLTSQVDTQLYSRNGISFKGRYPGIDEGLLKQEYEMILDGEIVAYNKKGYPDFQLLQHFADNPDAPVIFHIFDLLQLNGHDTRSLTLIERKELLKEALVETPHLKYCDHIENRGIDFYRATEKSNIEGVMAKKKSSLYTDGKRSEEWLKIKNHLSAEVIITGFTEPRGSRKHFGSLILGRYINGKLKYVGHVGTGFSDSSLNEIYELLKPLITKKMPFDVLPVTNMPPTWVKPQLVASIKYTAETDDGKFRHPVFAGIREDITTEELKESETEITNNSSVNKIDLNVEFTNIDKLYWKKEKISKGELIDYYLSISEFILPHLKNRAQSLHRFPNGIDKPGFYHKDAGKDAPWWVETISIFSESSNRDIEYIVCNNAETLGYLINLGCIELNPWSNTIENEGKPDYLILDLDPSYKNSFKQVIEVVKMTKEILDEGDITGYCKTSGSSGIHIFIPMGAQYEYDQVKDFALLLMTMVNDRLPKITTLERSLSKRGPKIYLDYLQNRDGQTVASVYSARPKVGAPVSMPIEWKELTDDLSVNDFTIKNALSRIEKRGDLFLPVLGKGPDLEKALDKYQ